jgi:hypothetical protein
MCVLIWNASIARLGPMSNMCFSFGMQILQGQVSYLVCVLVLECKYCKVESHVQCVLILECEYYKVESHVQCVFKFWNANIARLGPRSSVFKVGMGVL